FELAPGAKEPKKTKIYQLLVEQYDPVKGKIVYKDLPLTDKAPKSALDTFFREVVFDDKNPQYLTEYMPAPGLVTPLPELLTGYYPELKIKDIKGPPKPDAPDPKTPAEPGPGEMKKKPREEGGGIKFGGGKDPRGKPPGPEIKPPGGGGGGAEA